MNSQRRELNCLDCTREGKTLTLFSSSWLSAKISSIIKLQSPAIHLLSTDILVSTFDLIIHDDSDLTCLRKRKRQPASVSQHWRDVVLYNPILLSTVVVSEHGSAFAETCVKRGLETPSRCGRTRNLVSSQLHYAFYFLWNGGVLYAPLA